MAKIVQLSPHVANLIAAGEVVERPASVVKELLENAVDAGAHQVLLEIESGGMRLIRVTDDGCGMLPEDAETAFLRHATSKLRSAEDLASIHTMGFRGEALAAIASVSRVDILTRAAGEQEGCSLHLEAGVITERMPAGCPEGTSIFIRDLFYNTPARMKFMKRDSVEAGAVQQTVQNQAFAHPDVSFEFRRDGASVLTTPGSGDLQTVIYQIMGRQAAREMVPVDGSWGEFGISGFASIPGSTRGTRAGQFFFVNGRPVKSRLLMAALEQAYQNRLLPGRYPFCVLHLTVPDSAVDVNVHPAKTEIKFASERDAFDCLHYGVRAALDATAVRPSMQLSMEKQEPAGEQMELPKKTESQAAGTARPKNDFYRTMTAEEYRRMADAAGGIKDIRPSEQAVQQVLDAAARQEEAPQPRQTVRPAETAGPLPVLPAREDPVMALHSPVEVLQAEQKPEPAPGPAPDEEPAQQQMDLPEEPDWHLAGELFDTYIIAEQGDTAWLIDKHAAHERILFEKLKAQEHSIVTQELVRPVRAEMSAAQSAAALEHLAELEELGFVLSDIGGEVLIRAVPADIRPEDAGRVLEALSAQLLEGRRPDPEDRRDRMLRTVACKAAIKGGWKSHEEELRFLAGQVLTREELRCCPHGRPVIISLTRHQMEKQFKRT